MRADDSQAILEVADEGPGLSDGEAAPVFERFYRADAARARTGGNGGAGGTGGTGLGLSIVAAIVAAHGGTVHAGAPPSGRGAYFLVALPITPPPPNPGSRRRRRIAPARRDLGAAGQTGVKGLRTSGD